MSTILCMWCMRYCIRSVCLLHIKYISSIRLLHVMCMFTMCNVHVYYTYYACELHMIVCSLCVRVWLVTTEEVAQRKRKKRATEEGPSINAIDIETVSYYLYSLIYRCRCACWLVHAKNGCYRFSACDKRLYAGGLSGRTPLLFPRLSKDYLVKCCQTKPVNYCTGTTINICNGLQSGIHNK